MMVHEGGLHVESFVHTENSTTLMSTVPQLCLLLWLDQNNVSRLLH